MFEWRLTDLNLINKNLNEKKECAWMTEISTKDKMDFIDKMTNNNLSYIINLVDKFNNDRKQIKKDEHGYIKTVSLKAWLKRNDIKKIVDSYYHYGEINFLGCSRNIKCEDFLSKSFMYDTWDNYIDELFYRLLIQCQIKEKIYFKAHDEKEVLKSKLMSYYKKYKINFNFNLNLDNIHNTIILYDEDYKNKRELTIAEMRLLLLKYQKIEKEIEKISKEIEIKY